MTCNSTMKKLFLIRHSKAEPARFFQDDKERYLTEDGISIAQSMAIRLMNKGISLDAIVYSAAIRTQQTATIFAHVFQLPQSSLFISEELYLADTNTYLKTIRDLENRFGQVAIVGHNPGITETANSICENLRIDHMPVCSIVAYELKLQHWKEYVAGTSELLFFQHPEY